MVLSRKRTLVAPKDTMLIVTASPTMAVYFSRVRKDCRYGNMTVELVNAKSATELVKVAARKRVAGKFASTWAVFGMTDFEEKIDMASLKKMGEDRKVRLAWTNPDLGLWLYLHIKELNVVVDSSESFTKALEKVFPGYQCTAEYFSNEGQDIHLRLFSSFSSAVLHADSYNKLSEKKYGIPATTFVDLYEDIKAVCGEADLTHNQKLLAK
ncbi:MAG: RloB domain-containing protein [Sphaerochaetaceae bacterium]|nr:RloB domain-containing protein [Sphaerochaetaceae bacterium]